MCQHCPPFRFPFSALLMTCEFKKEIVLSNEVSEYDTYGLRASYYNGCLHNTVNSMELEDAIDGCSARAQSAGKAFFGTRCRAGVVCQAGCLLLDSMPVGDGFKAQDDAAACELTDHLAVYSTSPTAFLISETNLSWLCVKGLVY